ncbi:MAG: biosynthetic arginine decarboxylase [Pseudanabaenaceae cyanobacterium SKYGB_i_bin29]|nr:biosynthetic arginine decarboxylase [Pseudanabaenaceae cyanobacterium SKYG29]MDW8421798.1 biosynthetic arginine decarboxylase [Pseudanabaenaceae cyanobacterium SKYGB_i_bin29]
MVQYALAKKQWTIQDSEDLYRIKGWGEPYFSINEAGHVTVTPAGERGGCIDLYELVEDLRQRNLRLPLLVRFSDILADRIERLNACFARAIARYNYNGVYRGVYPVKVNQQRQLVEELVRFGKPYQFGLEAGSKPELLIALALLQTPGALLICNGYKDAAYIETALLSQRLGQTPIVVLEQLEELDLVLRATIKLGIKPILGVRAKLSTKGTGRWGESAGDRAKFGLSIYEILEVVDRLRDAGLLDTLQLLHFHIGSQISSISVIKDALREASQIYVQLALLGANMQYMDVGGGLGVDYDGSQTNFYASQNYTMQNYAYDVVAAIKEACAKHNIPVPTIVSESGRAIAAHQSVLIMDVVSVSGTPTQPIVPPGEDDPLVLKNIYETLQNISEQNYQEAYHDATQFKEEATSLFSFGYISLKDRARVERIYYECCERILAIMRRLEYVPDDLEELEKFMAKIYYCNFSVFQSVPDSWAIDQLFPIMPIHRLNEEPTWRGTLADLTCDSDGKIDKFIDLRDVKSVLELHPFVPGEHYYLGIFLAGAYQEILGDLHNLFGDTDAVHIHLTPGGYQVEHVIKGDSMTEVLQYVQYDRESLLECMRRQTEKALQQKQISLTEARLLLQNYETSLNSYTYLS